MINPELITLCCIIYLGIISLGVLIILKSTVLPGTTKQFRNQYKLNIVHSPEYLAEASALLKAFGLPFKK